MSGAQPVCPECGERGRKVHDVTPRSLLEEEAKARLEGVGDLHFCKRSDCDVVYFGDGGVRFGTKDLSVPVFQKSTDPQRFVCYCFEHTVASISEEVQRTGTSAVPDLIAAKCKEGLDHCEETNPQGTCCLGNVRQVMKAAAADAAADPAVDLGDNEAAHDCCAPRAAPVEAVRAESDAAKRPRNVGLWSAGGALAAALLSSACCWLPLLLIGAGASAAGVAGFFEAYRAWFLGATGLLLGAGFYFVYIRKPRCAPGEACEVPNPKLQRMNRVMLWIATVFVAAFAAFPNYVGVLLGGGGTPAAAQTAGISRTYAIEGMTCEGCATHVREAIEKVPGVVAADVSYPERRARVTFSAGTGVDDGAVLAAIANVGYRSSPEPPAGGAP